MEVPSPPPPSRRKILSESLCIIIQRQPIVSELLIPSISLSFLLTIIPNLFFFFFLHSFVFVYSEYCCWVLCLYSYFSFLFFLCSFAYHFETVYFYFYFFPIFSFSSAIICFIFSSLFSYSDREPVSSGRQAGSPRLQLLRAECLLDVFSPDAGTAPRGHG